MKEQVERHQLKQNIMERIIFRIDYAGVISITDLIQQFAERFIGVFNNYEITFHDHIELETFNIEEVSKTLSIPVKELQRQEIHRFTESELGSDNLTFDINKYYSVLNIECKKYETIDKYLELITDYMSFLKEINKLLSLKRFGLRKIGSKIFPSYPSIFEDFEKDKLNSIFDQTKYQKDKSDFLDVLSTIDNIYKFNYRRSIEKGYLKISNEEEKIGFRVILDIDGFVEEKVLNEITIDKKSLIETLNNVYLFHLFKTSVTENFLKNNMK